MGLKSDVCDIFRIYEINSGVVVTFHFLNRQPDGEKL